MSIPHRTAVTLLALASTLSFCGKKKSKTETQTSTTTGRSFSSEATGSLNLTQTFDAVTPAGLKTQPTSLSLDEADSVCDALYPTVGGPENKSCKLAFEIRQRFFQKGPTVIRDRLKDFESRLSGTLERSSDAYLPCLNPNHTQALTLETTKQGGNETVEVPAFKRVDIALKQTYKNNLVLDTQKTLSVSCKEEFGDPGSQIRVAFGKKDGTWSLFQEQANGIGSFGTVDSSDNIELWFVVGDRKASATQDALEAAGSSARTAYSTSSGVAHILAKPNQGFMGISLVGSGVGPGCGSQILINDNALYFKGNINNYGKCYADDFGSDDSGPAYDSSLNQVELCMEVSGSQPTKPTNGITHCVQSGLLQLDDNGAVQDPFTAAGLKKLTAVPGGSGSTDLFVRAYMGPHFMADADLSQIPKMLQVPLMKEDKIEIKGFHAQSAVLTPKTTPRGKVSVSAACNASVPERQTAFEEEFRLGVEDFLKAKVEKAKSTSTSPSSSSPTLESLLTPLRQAFLQASPANPLLKFTLNRSLGTSFRGSFFGTYQLSTQENGTAVKSGDLVAPGDAASPRASTEVDLQGLALESNSVVVLKLKGTLQLDCDNSNGISRTVGLKIGLPQLQWQETKSNP